MEQESLSKIHLKDIWILSTTLAHFPDDFP